MKEAKTKYEAELFTYELACYTCTQCLHKFCTFMMVWQLATPVGALDSSTITDALS